jgi:hypothetical protein
VLLKWDVFDGADTTDLEMGAVAGTFKHCNELSTSKKCIHQLTNYQFLHDYSSILLQRGERLAEMSTFDSAGLKTETLGMHPRDIIMFVWD